MHAARARRLLAAVDALVGGRQLTLTGLARSWPGATWVHAPLKAMDRLLSNPHLHAELVPLHQAMAPWLLERTPRPVVLVDWADLERDGRWALLRASVPMKGRALTLYEQVFPRAWMGKAKAEREFLQRLAKIVPASVQPVVVTDAGFRSDWFRAVHALGWDYLGRLRGTVRVRTIRQRRWRRLSDLHGQARGKAKDLGRHVIVKSQPLVCRLVVVKRRRTGRDQLTRQGQPQQRRQALKARSSAREPWVLATSLHAEDEPAHRVTAFYAKRMQIEEAFRDLKSHRYGVGFEDSLTRKAERLAVLLMLHTLASLAAWWVSQAAAQSPGKDPLARQVRHRAHYSAIRRGMEWLRRSPWPPCIATQLEQLLSSTARIIYANAS